MLGGSSSVNGMVYNRGARPDYDALVDRGNPEWGWDSMLPVFKRIEDHQLGASEMRGAGGPLRISVAAGGEPVSEALMASAAGLGATRVDDVNCTDVERVGITPATIHRGLRQSAATAFLRPVLGRENLTLRTGLRATRVLFEADRAVGVETLAADGTRHEFRAAREVILSLGSPETPKLLELSGIGDPAVLAAAGVEVRVASPRVGEGIHEHRCVPLQMRLRVDQGYNRRLFSRTAQGFEGAKYLLTRSGPMATPAYDMVWFMRTSDGLDRPDAQVLMAPFTMGLGLTSYGVERRPGFSFMGFPLRPTSEGSTHIVSSDPLAAPRLTTGYLTSEEDRTTTVAMVRRMREMVRQEPIGDLVLTETQPGLAVEDDESILRAAFLTGTTGSHASGAVAMGPTDDYPLDSRLRVRGVDGLRVVDVSIMPTMVAGNLNGPMMAMAYRAAELIRDDSL
jgi:choline dehydrogenase